MMVVTENMLDDMLNEVFNLPLSEHIKKIETKEQFCIGMVILADIIEEDPEEGTQRYDDMVHLCKILAEFVIVTHNGRVVIPINIFCKIGVLAEDYPEDVTDVIYYCDEETKCLAYTEYAA